MDTTMKTKNGLFAPRARRHTGMLLGALSLLTLGLGACGDLDWLRDQFKGHGGGTPVPDAGPPGTPVPDAGSTGGGADAGACVSGKLDHTVTCEDAPSGKDQAWAACRSLGLELADIAPAQCNAGQVLSISYLCCPAGTPPGTPTTVPPPESCIDQILGSPTTCKTVSDWKNEGVPACGKLGLKINDATYAETCADSSYRFATFQCCTLDGSPVPPGTVVGPPDPFTGPPLDGDGPSHYAQYKCCLSPTTCIVMQSGGLYECKDRAAHAADAKTTCDGKGGTVSGLGLYGACAP